MVAPSFEQFIEFLRKFANLSPKIEIAPATRFERDLGITGDDGIDLLEEAEKQFGINFSSDEHSFRETFNLKKGEYLFHSEGFDLFGKSNSITIREFTIGELYHAVCRKSSQIKDCSHLEAEHKTR